MLYDGNGFRMKHGGVARYFAEMIKRLPPEFPWELAMENTITPYLMEPPFNLPRNPQTVQDFVSVVLHGRDFKGVRLLHEFLARLFPRRFPSGDVANGRALRAAAKRGDFDVFHLTDPHPAKPYWRRVARGRPIVATVHDLIPETLWGLEHVRRCRTALLSEAAHIIAVSENTKRDVIRVYGTPEGKISVVHHGHLPAAGASALTDPPRRPYLLFVGKRDGYKRFAFMAEAVSAVLRKLDLFLFCTGDSFSDGELAMLDRLGIRDRVVQRFVPDAEMPALFAGALAFVYPSEYEGFGIPILDAFAAGCPVVLSDCSCFPEVGGDAALYFGRNDGDALCAHVENLFRSEPLRRDMIGRGRKRAALFTWEECAGRTAEVYARVVRERGGVCRR